MKGIYSKNMLVIRGKKHTYVVMDLDYSSPEEVIVYTDSYIPEAIYEFPEEMTKTINTLVGNQLLKVDDA